MAKRREPDIFPLGIPDWIAGGPPSGRSAADPLAEMLSESMLRGLGLIPRRDDTGLLGDVLYTGVDYGMPALGMFAGVKAKTADLAALNTAKDMASKGINRDAIWNETGWFQGADNKWRFEIPDDQARTLQNSMGEINLPETRPETLGGALAHPDAYAAYPEMERMRFGVFDNTYEKPSSKNGLRGLRDLSLRTGGQLTQSIGPDLKLQPSMMIGDMNYVSKGSEKPKSVILHELQHAIQGKEGLAGGAHPDVVGKDVYPRLAGEVEARNVQSRMRMTPEQRRMVPPWVTQDVADADQIKKYGIAGLTAGGGAAAALGFDPPSAEAGEILSGSGSDDVLKGTGGSMVNLTDLNPLFAARLSAAIAAAEKATGAKANFSSGKRTAAQGREIWNRATGGGRHAPSFPAARPGRSLHEQGMAVDLRAGPVRDWVQKHAKEYGLEPASAKRGFKWDRPHIQLARGTLTTRYDSTPNAYAGGAASVSPAVAAVNEMAAATPPRTLRKGMSGPDVDVLGQQLGALGYDTGTPRDRFGGRTQAAVRDLERQSGGFLDVDRGIAGPQVRDLLAGTDRTRNILSLPQAQPGGPSSITPEVSSADYAMGGVPAMPWDAPGGPAVAPRPVPTAPVGPDPTYADDAVIAAMDGAPGGPSAATALESAMGPSTPEDIVATPDETVIAAREDPFLPSSQPNLPRSMTPANRETYRGGGSMMGYPGVGQPADVPMAAAPGGPIDPATLAILERRAGVLSPAVGNMNYDNVASADSFAPPRMPQIERAAPGGPAVANWQDDVINRLSPGVSIQDVIDTFFGSRAAPATAEPIGRQVPLESSPFGMPQPWNASGEPPTLDDLRRGIGAGLSSPMIPGGTGPQSSLMGFGGDNTLIGSGSDYPSFGPSARAMGYPDKGFASDFPVPQDSLRDMHESGQRNMRWGPENYNETLEGLPFRYYSPAMQPSPVPKPQNEYPTPGRPDWRGADLMGSGGNDTLMGGAPDFGPAGGESRFPQLTPGGPGYVTIDMAKLGNGTFDMNAAPIYAPPRRVSSAVSPADRLSDAMRSAAVTGAGRSAGDIGSGSGSPSGYSTMTPAQQTKSWIQSYLGSFGAPPGQYGQYGSPFVPGGFAPANFNPKSGGSVYAIDKNKGTYIDSNGVERSIW